MSVVDIPNLTASLQDARRRPVPAGELSAAILRHGSMELRLYQPDEPDGQATHDRNELYVVASGSAVLLLGNSASPWEEAPLVEAGLERIPLRAGDAAVVPAGTVHRFVEITDHFATWAVFWGPEGGEQGGEQGGERGGECG